MHCITRKWHWLYVFFVTLQMVNTLALLLSSEERRRSRYAVETLSNDSDLYDSDLFVQGLLKVLTRASFCLSINSCGYARRFRASHGEMALVGLTLGFDRLHACVYTLINYPSERENVAAILQLKKISCWLFWRFKSLLKQFWVLKTKAGVMVATILPA